ncbi:MAG: hypothetical protein IKP21_05360, partial [Bacteroidales bacterium]|nr:hypothetical protein [Bacteroidales bacterium]
MSCSENIFLFSTPNGPWSVGGTQAASLRQLVRSLPASMYFRGQAVRVPLGSQAAIGTQAASLRQLGRRLPDSMYFRGQAVRVPLGSQAA